MASALKRGLILLGNSGVGKSFLANRLLDDDTAFVSTFSARSVTRRTEWKELVMKDGTIYSVANIPGLLEANQILIDENRTEIMKALDECDLAIILFVFGHNNGRIPDEDLIAFMRINDAYEFAPQSVLLIVNGIPKDRPDDYEEKTTELLHELVYLNQNQIYFFEEATSEQNQKELHHLLHHAVEKCTPTKPRKKHDIQLITDEIAQLKMESKQRQRQLMAQAEQFSRRQKIDLSKDACQKSHEPPLGRWMVATNEPTFEDVDTAKQHTKWLNAQRADDDRFLATIGEQQRTLYTDVTETAQNLNRYSRQTSEELAQMQSSPMTVTNIDRKTKKKTVWKKTKTIITKPFS